MRKSPDRILLAASLVTCAAVVLDGPRMIAQAPRPPAIVSISVCSPTGAGGQGSCPSGGFDTHQIVLAPDGNSINKYGVDGISDEHSSVFSPGTLGGNSDYLFFVASGTALNVDIGATVLSGGSGPDKNGQWHFDFAKTDGYGSYPSGFGHVFVQPIAQNCPTVADGNPAHQDQTFDLNYAAPGSVVKDPTNGPGSLLMIYEGVNSCIGDAGGAKSGGGNAYISVDVATSLDYGKTWPTYRGTPTFIFVPLPGESKTQGPHVPLGAFGVSVCMGNDCTTTPPAAYGRYPVLSPPYSLATAMATGKPLPGILADGEPAAFLDDVAASPMPYVYEIHGYHPSSLANPPLPNGRGSDLMIARAKLNGGSAPLSFMKWNGQSYASPGVGGVETPVLADGPYQNCGDAATQVRHSGSISYVENTQQYLLFFNCESPTDPASGQGSGNVKGAAWFYSTSYDLTDPGQWSPPREVIGSWNLYDAAGSGCWKGLYPTLMSLNAKPGHLEASGHVFYMWGCGGGGEPRQYSSRAFTITIGPAASGATLLLSPDGTTVYDILNSVNWLGDANLASSNRFGLPLCNGSGTGTKTCVNASGSMNYGAATAWVAAMNTANYLGHGDWQLPTTPFNDSACAKTGPNGASFGFGCTAGALASMYNALGLKPPNTAVPIPNNSASPFSNLQPYLYWSQTSGGPNAGNLTFSFATGWQGANTLPNFLYLLPMIRGTVPGTPPAAGNGLQVSSDKQTVYDPMTNSTWVANANLAATNRFGLPPCTNPTTPSICVAQDGAMTYASATQFITNMNTAAYLGQTHWQMSSIDTGCPGYTCNGDRNPMGNLFYDQLGILPGMPAVATPNIAVGPFHNLQPYLYWACQGATIRSVCSTDVPAPNFEWSYSFGSGFQGTDLLANSLYVTAYFPAPLQPFVNAGQALTASAGGGSINVTLPASYAWTASTTANWITITGGGSGVGNGTLTYQVAPNAGTGRSATITVAGFSFTVEQAAFSIPGLARAGSLAQVASEGTWKFTLDAVNLGTDAATARFNFADNLGNPLTMPLTFPQLPPAVGPLLAASLDRNINPSAQLVVESTGPDSAPALVGWGQLLTNGNIGGFGIFSNPKVGWNAVVPLETRNASRYILAFDNTGTLATGVAVANLAPQPANVPILIRDDTGARIGTSVLSLGALGHTSFMLNDSQFGFPVTANKRGTIEFETPPAGQISVLGLRANGPALTTLPVLANVGAGGGSITHATYNGGFTSEFYIVNTGTVPAMFTLSFFDEGGNALQVPLVLPQTGSAATTSALTSTLAAGALLVVQTQSQDLLPSVLGSAQLASTGSVSGFEIFLWIPFGQEASVPLETRTPNSFVLLFDDTTGLTTGVAVANLASSAANIIVNLRDDTGALLSPSAPINLPARGHTSFLLPTNYSVTSGKRGTAEFVVPTGGKISVIGLRAKSDGTLTTIPLLTK